MILPDVNLLVHAFNATSPEHAEARAWWEQRLANTEPVCLAWVAILGFVRLTTGRTISANPWRVQDALTKVELWLEQPNVRIVQPTPRHAELCFGFLRTIGAGGNLTTDAHLAALAVEHGCTLYSTDTDFARFPGLKWENPLRPRRSR